MLVLQFDCLTFIEKVNVAARDGSSMGSMSIVADIKS